MRLVYVDVLDLIISEHFPYFPLGYSQRLRKLIGVKGLFVSHSFLLFIWGRL